jgi:RNA-directed DNA polymerase
VNTGAPGTVDDRIRVLKIQAKLHRWAGEDAARRFDDLFNLVVDPAVLAVAWARVRGNRGARTAGVDGMTAQLHRTRARGGAVPHRLAGRFKGPAGSPRCLFGNG